MRAHRWIRDLPFILFLGLVSLALAILGAEAIARRKFPQLAASPERQQRPEELFMRFDPHLGWSHVPDRRVRFRRIDFDVQVSINKDGFRGEPVPRERAPGRFRVLFLGDSFAFGHGVEDDETAAAQLGRRLPGCEVVNLGVTGYSTDQELLLLRERGLDYDPDVVVLMLCNNDLLDNGKETAWGLYWKPRFLLDGDSLRLERERLPEGVPFRLRLARDLNRRFVLYEVLSWKLAERRLARRDPRQAGSEDLGRLASGRRLTRRLIEEIVRSVSSQGGQVLLAIVPGFQAPEILAGLPAPGTGARLELEPILEAATREHPDSAIGFAHDSHWNARGHRIVAEAIATAIREQGWLPTEGLSEKRKRR